MLFSGSLTAMISGAVIVLVTITVHELAHGYTAYLLGDNTAKNAGRLSLNPLAHLDPLGAILLFVTGFGWAKPVPINPFMFKNRKKGIILVSLAGPGSNFILAVLSMVCLCLLYSIQNVAASWVSYFFLSLSTVNIGLGLFNLIPIPPLDGSKVLSQFLPMKARVSYLNFERYGGILLFLLIYFGHLSEYLNIAMQFVFTHMLQLISGIIL